MPSIFDLTSNQPGVKKLFQKFEEEREKEIQARKDAYRKRHIFKSYEEALDWCMNTGKGIQWHTQTLFYDTDKNKFKSYEQDFDLDGIVAFDVIRYYTKEELIEKNKEGIAYINNKYPEHSDETWWLDKEGYLEYVYVL